MSTQLWPLSSEAVSVPDDLFSKVKYFTTGSVTSDIMELLTRGGAVKSYCLSPFTSLLIVGPDGGEEVVIDEAEDMLDISAVSCAWVLASCHVGTRLPMAPFRVRGQRLFSGVTVLMPEMAGLSAEDRARLWAMVTWHGGRVLNTESEARPSHVVTSVLVSGTRDGARLVTPNWVVDSVKRRRLQDEDSEEYTDFVKSDDSSNSEKEDVQSQVENRDCSIKTQELVNKPEIFSPNPEDYTKAQNELIKSYISKLDKTKRDEFYRMSTAEKRQVVVERGLIIKIENGSIQLSKEQKQIIDESKEPPLTNSCDEKVEISSQDKDYYLNPRKQQDTKLKERTPSPKKISPNTDVKSNEDGDNEADDEAVSLVTHMNLTPRKEKAKITLSDDDRRAMMKMNRMQKQLYLQKIEKSPQSPARAMVLGRAEAKLNSPQVTRPSNSLVSKSVSSSPLVLSSPTKRVSSTDSTPSTPKSAPRSSSKISPRICLLGCHFVITGYQDREEACHVTKWSTVITRHGGEVSSELGERVTHVLCPDLESALARRAEEMGLRLVTAHWLNDVITVKKMAAPWKGVHLPLPRAGDRGSDISSMRISVTGFEGLDRDYVKDMIEMAGAEYTACLTRDNTAIVCREAAGEKFRKSSEWNIPAVSIKWLNEALFSRENVADKLTDPRFRNFDKHKQPLGVSSKLVSSYLRPWKSVIEVTRSDYYEYKQRLSSAAEKRSLELDDRILTPGGKRRKLDPRSLFDKVQFVRFLKRDFMYIAQPTFRPNLQAVLEWKFKVRINYRI